MPTAASVRGEKDLVGSVSQEKPLKHPSRFPVWFLSALVLLTACCNCSGSSPATPVEPTAQGPGTSAGASAADPAVPVDPRERVIAVAIDRLLESEHVRRHDIDDATSKVAFPRYLDAIDPGKLFMLQSDVDGLSRYADKMDDEMKNGQLALAHAGAAMLLRRLGVVEKLVAAQLTQPFDFTRDDTLQTDEEKIGWAKSEAELTERWRKNLQLEALVRVVNMDDVAKARAKAGAKAKDGTAPKGDDADKPDAGVVSVGPYEKIPDTLEGREKKARADMAKSYAARFTRLQDIEPLDPVTTFVNAVASTFDPHTTYLPPADKENFDIRMSGSLEGIGAVLQEDDHYIKVVQIVPGGASWRQGDLEAGDLIMAVTQASGETTDVVDMRIDKVVQMIRGKSGTRVTLTVKKPDNTTKVIPIVRDVVKIEESYARGAIINTKGGKSVGYIYLPSFYGNTRAQPGQTAQRDCSDDVHVLLDAFAKKGVGNVILDIRGNGGGLLDDAKEMAGLFISTGPVVQTVYADGDKEVLSDKDPTVSFRGNVVVLVDQFSASASEIVAAALQDYHRAVIVGTNTHGKGTVQMLVDLDRVGKAAGASGPLGVFKLTTQQFYRVNGGSTQWKGVVPDISLPNPNSYIESGERSLKNSIPWSETGPLQYTKWASSWDLAKLAANSSARVAKSDVFGLVLQRDKLLEARKNDTIVPLSMKKWLARRDQQKAQLDATDPKIMKHPEVLKVSVLDYDGAAAALAKESKGRKVGSSTDRWRDNLAHDPWVQEATYILRDMGTPASVATH